MKKILIFMIMLLLVGCNKEEQKVINKTDDIKEEEEKEEIKEEYVDNNPIKVSLYRKGKKVYEYKTKFKNGKDIATFNIVYTDIDDLGSTNLKNNWNKYYNEYENIEEYKIGFYFTFEANGKKYENLMLDPSTQYKLDPYLYAYLYDGVHAKGHYTHLEMKDINDNTIYSSIKLYLHRKTDEITSPITLTVFTYKDENDFLDGMYRGKSSYTITIYNE